MNGLPGLPELAELVWQLTAELRREAHRGHPVGCGAAAPYGRYDPAGMAVRPGCRELGCLDLVHDVLLVVQPRLAHRVTVDGPPEDPLRYANATVKRVVADLGRERRVQLGLPAKPTRSDGPAAQVEAELLADVPEESARTWWRTLFRLVRAYPCRPGPAGRSWPLDAWTVEKSLLDQRSRTPGTREARAEIEADIRHVLAVVDRVAGSSWRFQAITEPLQRGTATTSVQELPPSSSWHPATEPLEDAAMVALFEGYYRGLRASGVSPAAALRGAAARVFGREPRASVRQIRALAADLELGAAVA